MNPVAVLRSATRSVAFLLFIAGALAVRALAVVFSRRARSRSAATRWLQATAEGCRRILHLRIAQRGTFPAGGLLVANHLSYLDIILLAARHPCVFVSKSEVRTWPIFGWCAALGGTLFIDRSRRGDVAALGRQMSAALAEGSLLVLFPEGTSTGGDSVLPFKSSLLEPAVQLGCPVCPAAIRYHLAHGSVADEICYWGDMTLLPHLLHVFALPEIHATLHLAPTRPRTGERKAVARALHSEVAALYHLPPAEPSLPTRTPRPIPAPLELAGARA